jgi:hypothetical protein
LNCIVPEFEPLEAVGYGVDDASHPEHLLCNRGPPNSVAFPKVPTKPQRQSTSLTQRLSTIDPSSILDDKIAAELLALIPGTSGLCLWSGGQLQILAPHLTIEEAAELELPESSRISISVSRWSPKPTCPQSSCLSNVPDNGSRDLKMVVGKDTPRAPSQASNNDLKSSTSMVDSSPPIPQIEVLVGEQSVTATKARPSGSLPSRIPDRSLIVRTEESNLLLPGTSIIERNQLSHNEHHLPCPNAFYKLDSLTGPARNGVVRSTQIGTGSDKAQNRITLVEGDYGDSADGAKTGPGPKITASELLSMSEPVRHGDAGPSLPRVSTLMNGSATTKSIMGPQVRRPFSAPDLRLVSVAQTTPPAATPPPADPEPPAPQAALTPALPPRCMKNDSRVFIGPRSHCATAGVKVRRTNGDGEQYLTISTHAAFNGVNEKPLPVCVPKKLRIFKKPKPVKGIIGASVLDAGDSSLVCMKAIAQDVIKLTCRRSVQFTLPSTPLSWPPLPTPSSPTTLVKILASSDPYNGRRSGSVRTKPYPGACHADSMKFR